MRASRVIGLAVALVAIAGAFFLPIELPISLDAPGRIMARREWSISRGEDGRLISVLRDNRERTVESVAVSVYDRGDRIEVVLRREMKDGAFVRAGDTIAVVRSAELATRWSELHGKREIERAALGISESGEKEDAVRAAQLEVERARAQVEFERRRLDRVRDLANRGMASAGELEEYANRLRAAEIEHERTTAELASIKSGAKTQEIAWQRARLRATATDAEIAARRLADSVIVAPFSGQIAGSPDSTTLVALLSVDSAVVRFPVPWISRQELVPGQPVRVITDGLPSELLARIHRTGNTSILVNGRQYIDVIATIDCTQAEIMPGLYVRCSVTTGKARPMLWLARELRLR